KNVRFDSGCSRISGKRTGSVPCGGRGQLFQAVMAGHGDSHSHSARFETPRGIGALFFQKGVGVAPASEHGRPTFAERYRSSVGQHGLIAPHARPGLRRCCPRDFIAMCEAAHWCEVVAHVKRTCTLRTNISRQFRRYLEVAARAFEVKNFGHACTIAARPRSRQVSASQPTKEALLPPLWNTL